MRKTTLALLMTLAWLLSFACPLSASGAAHTIYMTFAQYRIRNGVREKPPKIHLLKASDFTEDAEIPVDPDKDKDMERVYPEEKESTMWKFELTEEEFRTYSDAIMYFELKENENKVPYRKYHIGLAGDRDADNWTRYIYYPAYPKMGDHTYQQAYVARQSYMTFEQFDSLRSAEKEYLYITGQGFANLKGSGGGTGGTGTGGTSPLLTGDYITLRGSRGVFYADITKGGTLSSATPLTPLPDGSTGPQPGARFNMSWVHPTDWHAVNCPELPISAQRVQATFNLGIVGIDEENEAITTGKVQIVRGHGNTSGNEVFCTPGRTIPVANYNQADWFIRDKYIGHEDEDGNTVVYTLVVDLEPTCNSVSLLYFQPNPKVSAKGLSVEAVDFTDPDQAVAIRGDSEDRLSGESGAGPIVMSRVNVASAVAELSAPNHYKLDGISPAGLEYDYNVKYHIYSDGMAAGIYDGEMSAEGKARMTIDAVALGSAVTIGVRALYTDNISGLHFHSRYDEGVIDTGTRTFPTFESVGVGEKTFSFGKQELDGSGAIAAYTLGAYALVEVEKPGFPDGEELVWYADFNLACPDGYHASHRDLADGGEVVWSGHPAAALADFGFTVPVDRTYVPCVAVSDFTAASDWSSRLASTDRWPLHLGEVVRVEQSCADLPSAQIKGTASVVYPFLIDPEARISASSALSLREGAPARSFTVDPTKKYRLSYQAVPQDFSFSLNSNDLTGIENLMPEESEASEEYYDLRGVRVEKPTLPGMYVRRRGTTVDKILIR